MQLLLLPSLLFPSRLLFIAPRLNICPGELLNNPPWILFVSFVDEFADNVILEPGFMVLDKFDVSQVVMQLLECSPHVNLLHGILECTIWL
ncbi:hypothetical protein K435DRAFT_785091, partial [Dendrothele bispora CBS 962.96]